MDVASRKNFHARSLSNTYDAGSHTCLGVVRNVAITRNRLSVGPGGRRIVVLLQTRLVLDTLAAEEVDPARSFEGEPPHERRLRVLRHDRGVRRALEPHLEQEDETRVQHEVRAARQHHRHERRFRVARGLEGAA
jgi:hypothetical protein